MKCSFVTERLFEYRNGELPREQATEVEQHLSKCSKCREYADWFVGELASLRDQAPQRARLEDDFASHVIAGLLDTDVASLRRNRRCRLVFGVAAGIGAAALILAAVYLGSVENERPALVEGQLLGRAGLGAWELSWRDDAPLPEGVETIVPAATPTTMRLGVGKVARSEGATKLRYESNRIEVLAGRMRVEASEEASRLRAAVPGANVNVRSGAAAVLHVPDRLREAEGAPIEITVVEGAVDLLFDDGERRVVRSGQRAVLGSGVDRGRLVRVDADLRNEATTASEASPQADGERARAIPNPQRRLAVRMLLESLADGDPEVRLAALRTVRLMDSAEAAGQVYSILLEPEVSKELQLEALEALATLSLAGTPYAKFSPRFLVDLAKGDEAVPATVALRAGEIGVLLYADTDPIRDYVASITASLDEGVAAEGPVDIDLMQRGLDRAFDLPKRERSIALARAGVDRGDPESDIEILRQCIDFERESSETILWIYRQLARSEGLDKLLDVAFAPTDPGRPDSVSPLSKAVATLIGTMDREALEGTPGRAAALYSEAFEQLEGFVADTDTPDNLVFPVLSAIGRLRWMTEEAGVWNGPRRDAQDALLRMIASDRDRWSRGIRLKAVVAIDRLLTRAPVDVEMTAFFERMLAEEPYDDTMHTVLIAASKLPELEPAFRDLGLERVAAFADELRRTAPESSRDAFMLASYLNMARELAKHSSDVALPPGTVDRIRDIARSVAEDSAFDIDTRKQVLGVLLRFPNREATPVSWLIEKARSADPAMRQRYVTGLQMRISSRDDAAYRTLAEIASGGGEIGLHAMRILLSWQLSEGEDPVGSVKSWLAVADPMIRRQVVKKLSFVIRDSQLLELREDLLVETLREDPSLDVRLEAALALLRYRAREGMPATDDTTDVMPDSEVLRQTWRLLDTTSLDSSLVVEAMGVLADKSPLGMPGNGRVREVVEQCITHDLDNGALVVAGLTTAIVTGSLPSDASLAHVAEHPGSWWWSVLAASALRASHPEASPEIHEFAYEVLEREPATFFQQFRRLGIDLEDLDPDRVGSVQGADLSRRWKEILPALNERWVRRDVRVNAHKHHFKQDSSILAFREYLDRRDYYHTIMLRTVDSARGEIRAEAARMMLTEDAQGMPFTTVAVRLLSDRDESIREVAFDWLHRHTGEEFGYRPDATPGEREAAIEDWRAWWARSTEVADPMTRIFDAVSEICR